MRMTKQLAAAVLLLGGIAFLATPSTTPAADHGDAPNVAGDQACDLGDTYLFLDSNDNTKVIIAMTFRGFIVPGEAVNFTSFDPSVLYRFQIENTGDAKPDAFIDVTFSKRTATSDPQTATIKGPGKHQLFTAPTTLANLSGTAADPTVTTDPVTGISFFAGEVDDPFFFDIPAFGRFIASVRAGTPDATVFARGRDTFAGYNIQTIVMSVPRDLIRGDPANNKIGLAAVAMRRTQGVGKNGVIKLSGKFHQLDRSGVPAVNVALIPFARKDEYNNATTIDDSKGRFADDIVATLHVLGTDDAHIATLASVAVTTGDFLRLDLSVANTGTGGGNNAEAAFPNGRRLQDDVIDTILTIIANGATLGDNVNASDKPPRDQFPFMAAPNQPQVPGVLDDNTRN